MKRLFIGLLVSVLLLCLASCGGNTPAPVSSPPPAMTIATTTTTASTTTTTTSSVATTTVKPTLRAEAMRLTVLTPQLTAKTDQEKDGSRYLISLHVADYAPGTILKVIYDGRVMMSYPAQIVTQSMEDTGKIDKALTLIKGKIVDGCLDEGYAFEADEGGKRIYFTNRVQGLLAGMRGTLCLYDNGDRDSIPEGYFYTGE